MHEKKEEDKVETELPITMSQTGHDDKEKKDVENVKTAGDAKKVEAAQVIPRNVIDQIKRWE